MVLKTKPQCQAHALVADITKKKPGGADRPDTITLGGGKPMWHWVEMTEDRRTGAQKYYRPKKEKAWRQTRPYGIDYNEDSS